MQVPLQLTFPPPQSQYPLTQGLPAGHTTPHEPQLLLSFVRLAHAGGLL
jgi:hypothetical protein